MKVRCFSLIIIKICSIVKLDSETLPELARLDGEMTTQLADHFIHLIQADIPFHTFIHIGNCRVN